MKIRIKTILLILFAAILAVSVLTAGNLSGQVKTGMDGSTYCSKHDDPPWDPGDESHGKRHVASEPEHVLVARHDESRLNSGTVSPGLQRTVSDHAQILVSKHDDPPWDPGDENRGKRLTQSERRLVLITKHEDPPWDPGDESGHHREEVRDEIESA